MIEPLVRAFVLLTAAVTASAQPANPPQLVYGTYVGTTPTALTTAALGTTGGLVYSIAADSSGHAYIYGLGPTPAGGVCPFLTKLSPAGDKQLWTVCLPFFYYPPFPDPSYPPSGAVAVDSTGDIYVLGEAQDQEPTLLKFTPDGKRIFARPVPCGSVGMVFDQAGYIYVAGTQGSDPRSVSGRLYGIHGCVAKLDPTSLAVLYAGSVDFGVPNGIAVDNQGQIWAVGRTCACPGGGGDCAGVSLFGLGLYGCLYGTAATVRKLDATGAHVLVSQTIGGGIDGDSLPLFRVNLGVAVDAAGAAWITGISIIENSLQTFVTKLSSTGDSLFFKSSAQFSGISPITVDAQGRPYYVTYDSTTVVTGLSPDGSEVLVSSSLFSTPIEEIALDGSGGLYIAGNTGTSAHVTTPGAFETSYPGGGQGSGFAAKFDLTRVSAGQVNYVVNAASLFPNPPATVAPGEIVALLGSGIPANPKVTFDGIAAPILYADANQINAVVPFEITSAPLLSLEGIGVLILNTRPALPGLFTADGSGSGQVAALNEDGSMNSSSNPAEAGSVMTVFVTGVGAMTPPIGDGQLGPLQPPYPAPALGAAITINDASVSAPILFAGQAPGLIAGLVQINFQIPPDTPHGTTQLRVYIGNYPGPYNSTTVAIQ